MTQPEPGRACTPFEGHSLPGRWAGGVSMVVAPVLLLAGVAGNIAFGRGSLCSPP